MCDPIIGTVGAAVIGAGASIAGSRSASNASRDATRATTEANAANIQLAREQRAQNEALFAQYLGDENRARAYLDALLYGEGRISAGLPATSGGALSVAELATRYPQAYEQWLDTSEGGEGVLGRVFGRAPRQSFVAYLQAQGLDIGSAPGAATPGEVITRDQVMAEIADTPLAQFADQDYLERLRLLDEALESEGAEIDSEYDANVDVADRARTGRRAESQAQLDDRLRLNREAKAAWEEKAAYEAGKARDEAVSRFGVTGLAGNTARAIGDVNARYALDAYEMDAAYNRDAYDPYHAQNWDAENYYWGSVEDATGLRGNRRVNNRQRYNAGRASAYDGFAGDRTAAYGDFVDSLRRTSDRGYGARAQIAVGGQAYVDAATSANNSNASASRDAAYRRAEINNQLYGDLAQIGGDLYGSLNNRKTPTISAYKPAYSYHESAHKGG